MSTGSMSVHSLIDNFKTGEGGPPDDRTTTPSPTPDSPTKLPPPSQSQLSLPHQQRHILPQTSVQNRPFVSQPQDPSTLQSQPSVQNPQLGQPYRPPGQMSPMSPMPSAAPSGPILTKSSILSILGDDVKELKISEEALLQIVQLKSEQERTRQQQIKLDLAIRNHNILTTALNANIPGYLIPQMCVQPQDPPQMQHLRSESQSFSHSRSNSQDFATIPVNYRFGSGGSGTYPVPVPSPYPPQPQPQGQGPHGSSGSTPLMSTTAPVSAPSQPIRRPLSPAKIGAQAVANLSSPTTSYRFPPNRKPPIIPQHQRHFSMPVDPGRFKNPSIDLSKVDTHMQQQQKYHPYLQPPTSKSHSRSSSTPKQEDSHSRSRSTTKTSPLGSSTMQVKAAPAQPLQKSKSTQPPSQESMTSFQHVIQFQHWKPEDPSSPERQDRQDRQERSHKRHKSHADNMSVDMREYNEADMSMESEK